MSGSSAPANALDVACAAAREAGRIALDAFRRPQRVETKGRGNLVSETDFAIERFLHETFAREFPDHAILSEETASTTALDGWVWVIDPLDGTRNFVSGIPFFCVNIALCYDGVPVVAVTCDPNQDECYSAERGRGARLNDAPMRASGAPTVLQSVLGFDLGYDDDLGRGVLQLIHELFPGAQSVRIPGSAALGLAYAACGRYDLFVHHCLFPWDIAAGILLVQEAGGVITDHLGAPIEIASPSVIAGAPRAHADFLRWQQEHSAKLDLLSKK